MLRKWHEHHVDVAKLQAAFSQRFVQGRHGCAAIVEGCDLKALKVGKSLHFPTLDELFSNQNGLVSVS